MLDNKIKKLQTEKDTYHLYNKEKIYEFAERMYNRLESKKDEKSPMGGWSYVRILYNCVSGIIRHLMCKDEHDTVDIANFAFFIWYKKQIDK